MLLAFSLIDTAYRITAYMNKQTCTHITASCRVPAPVVCRGAILAPHVALRGPILDPGGGLNGGSDT